MAKLTLTPNQPLAAFEAHAPSVVAKGYVGLAERLITPDQQTSWAISHGSPNGSHGSQIILLFCRLCRLVKGLR